MMSAALVWGALLPVQAQHRLTVNVAPLYSITDFQWSIAGNSAGMHPNIYSELKWNHIQRIGMDVSAEWHFTERLNAGIHLSKNYTVAGKSTDTDYREDNRNNIAWHGAFNSNNGVHTLLAGSAGYKIPLAGGYSLTLCPGYTYSRETFYLLPADASTPGDLRTTYTVTWKGVTTGIFLHKNITPEFALTTGFSYSQLKYSAAANWNLIPQFNHPLSFVHTANGYALEPSLKAGYKAFYILLQYTCRITGKGAEQLYMNTEEVKETQLNGAVQKTLQLSIGFTARLLQKKGR